MNGGMGEEASTQIQVRFVTKLPPPLKIAARSIAVPSNLTRMGLSEIVNHIILSSGNSDHKTQPFDFLVDGELVRMPLDQFLLAKGISAEKVLEMEYIKAVIPRKEDKPYPHDDWISAVDASDDRYILTGCYDSHARIWRDGVVTHVLEGHKDAITSICIINEEDMESSGKILVGTASKDRKLRLWKVNPDDFSTSPRKIEPYMILNGHTSAVKSISSEPSSGMLCSGSWDCSIKLWATKEVDIHDDVVSLKKRKSNSEASNENIQLESSAVSTLNGHTQSVSSVVWKDPLSLYSASWDHSVRRWDVSTGENSWNMVCGKALNCMDIGGESSELVAAGGSDPVLRIWDPRRPGNIAPVYQFSSHTSWISSCKWHSKSWLHIVSASYDGKVMLWDLRTAWPLAIINSHTDKVLCAAWWRGDSVVSGGADAKLFISSGITVS